MEPVQLIETHHELLSLIKRLDTEEVIAVDTESNGFHAYFEKICLIQISTLSSDIVIDPLSIEDLQPLGDLFASSRIEKVFHAAANDVGGLKRDFGFSFARLFDTAIAGKLLGHRRLGLASMLRTYFGVQLNKKWQRCDWGKRPLTREQIDYARFDTHYLLRLRNLLAVELDKQDLWSRAQEAFDRLCEQPVQERIANTNGHLRIRGAARLDPAARLTLKRLYQYRDEIARRLDRAPFRVLSNEALLRLARTQPLDNKGLSQIKGLPRSYRKGRYARELIGLISKAQHDAALQAPHD